MRKPDDEHLVSCALKGDLQAFEQLVKQYERLVFHIVGKVVEQREDIEDICQDVFVSIYKKLGTYNHQAKLSTWIGTIAYRAALNHKRKRKHSLLDQQIESTNYTNPETDLLKKERSAFLREQIEKLPAQQQLILTLYHLEEMSYEEIGKITNLPEGTVKSYLFRARKQLKEEVQNRAHQIS